MASCHKKGNVPSMFKAYRPHFFKIILESSIRERKLGIPIKFVKRYGDYLSSSVLLKVPSGEKWKVEIVKCDGEIWLQNGWHDFVKYYSLAHGSFLVFEYEHSDRGFNVIIFDKSATEIDYPFSFINGDDEKGNLEDQVREQNVEEVESDVSVEILGHFLQSRKTEEKSPLPFPRPVKKMKLENSAENSNRNCPTVKVEEHVQVHNVEEAESGDASVEILGHLTPSIKTEEKSPLPSPQPNKMKLKNSTRNTVQYEAKKRNGGMPGQKQRINRTVTRNKPLTKKEKTKAIRRASTNFKSENPFFMIAVQPSYLRHESGTVVDITSFARKYLDKNDGDAIVNCLDGRSWSMKYSTAHNLGSIRTRILASGWIKFARDNELQVGDVCIFELIDCKKTTFRVSISKDTNAANCCSLLGYNSKQSVGEESSSRELERKPSFSNLLEAMEAANKFSSESPIFNLKITSFYLEHGYVHVPQNFINNIKKSQKMMLLVDNRCWPVKLDLCPSYRKGLLTGGWLAFARENSLNVGDVCIFELINSETVLIKVSILRHSTT